MYLGENPINYIMCVADISEDYPKNNHTNVKVVRILSLQVKKVTKALNTLKIDKILLFF